MPESSIIGRRAPLNDGRGKITGSMRFLNNISLPGMLHARLVTSLYAHARILGIDKAQALAVPGVAAVITAADLPEIEPTNRNRLMLARDRVLFTGHPVALVLAQTEAAAQDGAALVMVDYEPLPAALDLEAAMAPGAPLVWPDGLPGASEDAAAHGAEAPAAESERRKGGNVAEHVHYSWGDIGRGFAEADAVVERTFTTPVVHQAYLETQGCVVQPDVLTGGANVWTSTQGPFFTRKTVAEVLDIPESDVRVQATPVGGGFGGKFTLYEPLVALAARKANRPVKLVLTRMEEMQAANPAPAMQVQVRLGLKRDGSLSALEGDIVIDCGCYPFSVVGLASMLLGSVYRFPNLNLHGSEVLTFKPSGGAYRAPSAPNVALALESAIDEACRQLGLDPLDVRLKNAAVPGDPRVGTKKPWPSIGLREVLQTLKDHPAWRDREAARAAGRGVGVAVGGWPGGTEPAAAACMLNRDGTLHLHLGTVDLTGTGTSFAQLAAEAFGLSPEAVRVVNSDTSAAPYAGGAGGSKTIYTVGPAVLQAAREARARALEVAASEFEADPADLEIVDGKVRVRGVPDKAIPLGDIASRTMTFGGRYAPVVGHGAHADTTQAPGFCAQLAEVEVDRDTGEVTVHRLVMVQDVGRAINPLMIEGQMMGGGMQGLGWALYERIAYDGSGQLLTGSLMDYTVPRINHAATQVETIIIEVPTDHGPLGARGVGEPPVIATAGAVANAIADATGARLTDIPFTPQRVAAALTR
jgi:CO/xanthine dehydrogenase Mo-binding subunit